MKKRETARTLDLSTEARIKQAARAVFYRKGFAATRTRDIAEEAGINLALLNYYFRSKGKLFEIIMLETLSDFLANIRGVINDESTSLECKIEQIAAGYIDLIRREPEIPFFLLSEIRSNAGVFFERIPIGKIVKSSVFIRQYREAAANGKIAEPNPLHFIMNFIGMILFPFIASPVLKEIGSLDAEAFDRLMEERKKRIPLWINSLMKPT